LFQEKLLAFVEESLPFKIPGGRCTRWSGSEGQGMTVQRSAEKLSIVLEETKGNSYLGHFLSL